MEEKQIPRILSASDWLNVYPHPGHTSAKIEYSLSEPVWVGVSDASGLLLQVLKAAGWKDAGSYTLDWNPTDSKPGLLYVLLKTNEDSTSKKYMPSWR